MKIQVDPDWWKTLFDEVYLVTDSRSVDDDEVTRREMDIFTSLIPMEPEQRILDLCGGHGRHALELCRRGYRCCTVLDYSKPLIDIGKHKAVALDYSIRFVQGDARNTKLPSESYDHVLILGNSLGYIDKPDADLHILEESRRLLKSKGWLILDVTNGDAVKTKIYPQAWHEIGEDIVVCRQREVQGARIAAREMVLSKTEGIVRDSTYGIRLYAAEQLVDLVSMAGFADTEVHTDASAICRADDVGCMNHRLVIVARKP